MTISISQFEKYLLLYGSNLDQWPEDIQMEALQSSTDPAIHMLIIQHQYMEEMLLGNDRIEPARPELVQHILRACTQRTPRFNLMEWLGSLFADFHLPQPAYVLAALVLLGMSAGISAPDELFTEQSNVSDDGASL